MTRDAIPSTRALGVAVGNLRDLGKRLARNHELAAALWKTGDYEGRMLAALVDEPARVTPRRRSDGSWGLTIGPSATRSTTEPRYANAARCSATKSASGRGGVPVRARMSSWTAAAPGRPKNVV